ncbi:hypothetical protein G7Y41_07150 [Schaalia sp. ZJ405]|uniref:hypothetical protein n=1 Tax=Schaalia sp. ZJ405 TaxID=2709403 RepID=UPI0013EC79B2|nr:hypothetical protein [Schaalia sp. ZJ405]QPK80830.1 hypothetical protein G7Y41_07150 [Schaalia sp. ZJ405]
MMTVDDQRKEFTKTILKSLASHPENLPVVNDIGRQFVVTALGDEPMKDLFDRVKVAGGYANVFILTHGKAVLLPFARQEGTFACGSETELSMPCDADSTVDMFLDYLRQHPEGTLLRLAGPQHRPTIATMKEAVAV